MTQYLDQEGRVGLDTTGGPSFILVRGLAQTLTLLRLCPSLLLHLPPWRREPRCGTCRESEVSVADVFSF